MAKFKIRPYDDYKAWDTAETIEEARAKRSKLAMSFFSRRVVIVDENVFNDCYVLNLAIDHVCIDSNKGQVSIELNDIIGIQFTDKRAVVGMK